MTRSSFGNITQRPENKRWRARWQDSGGRQHSKTFATNKEAAAWLASVSTDRARGEWTDPRAGRIALAEWARQWRTTLFDIRPTTRDRDLFYLDAYILPTLGTIALGDLDLLTVQSWVGELTACGLAPATVVKASQVLSKMLTSAVNAKLIPASPVMRRPAPQGRARGDEVLVGRRG